MSDLDNLKREAELLYNEARGKLDDPNYKFNDGTLETSCQQLRDCASRCDAAGYTFDARQLETAAHDVEERGSDWED
jgi:hypothetical protein